VNCLSGPGQGSDELAQAVNGELAPFGRSWAGAELVDAAPVVGLVPPKATTALGTPARSASEVVSAP